MRNRIKNRVKIITVIGLIIFGFTAILIVAHFLGYEQKIKVEKDTYVSEYFPNKNYGTDDYLRVGNYDFGKVQTFYHFNISSLPDGWTEVEIIVNFDYGSNIVDVAANLTYESWDEMTITWNNKPNKSVYRGHILCDGFDFRIPLRTDQIVNDGVSVCLYGRGGEDDGYIQGSSKESASRSADIAWIELSYEGIDPAVLTTLSIVGIIIAIILGTFGIIILIVVIRLEPDKMLKKRKNNHFGADWLNAYTGKTPRVASLEKEINEYITLKLVMGRTIIYVNGKRFIQCIRLILNIPKDDVPLYDEVDSIDEAAKLYSKHVFQNRIVRGLMAAPVPNQRHDITSEQEFWGHCSNIQAWVEHDYDTRILMSNISFPLLRELTKAGDPKAKRVYKEEIALRLESGYPSVVQYLLTQGYLQVFSPEEFKTILESTDLIKNLSSNPNIFSQFIRSCTFKFPTLLEGILLQILRLPKGKNIFFSSFQINPRIFTSRPFLRYKNPQFLFTLKTALENILTRGGEEIGEDILDCIQVINNQLEGEDISLPDMSGKYYLEAIRGILMNNEQRDDLFDRRELFIRNKILEQVRKSLSKCPYCGKVIPKDQDICKWCGHKKDDDEDGFFPYPFIFKPPGGRDPPMKGTIAISVKTKAQT